MKQFIDNSYLLYNNKKLSATLSARDTTVPKEETPRVL